jgi:C4-dicarboxylate-specific signal transduction histidine kinase
LAHQEFPERHTVTTVHPPAEWLTWTTGVLLTLVGTAYLSAAAAHRLRDQRRRLDSALRAASGERAKLERVLDAAGAGLILLDDRKRIIWASQGFLDMSPEEENLDLLCRQCSQCAAMQALNEGRTVSADFSRTEADGTRRYYRATASPLGSGDEELGRVVEVIQDVTTSKAMEQEMIRTGKLAATGRLAAVIAHEVGNPLASLEARLSLMERSDDPGFARKSAPILRDQLARIERIVHGLSKFARPSNATVADTGVGDVIREVVDFLRFEPRARAVQIGCAVPADLPRVRPSRDELSQVFLNLALNGIQAVGKNGTVRFEARDENGQIVVTVTDDGPGVRPEVAPHIFEPFYSSKEHGVGLGLVISRSIVETHGGSLRFDEQHRPGARFVVTLPRADTGAESSA